METAVRGAKKGLGGDQIRGKKIEKRSAGGKGKGGGDEGE